MGPTSSTSYWDSNDPGQLSETEGKSMAMDQLMRFQLDGDAGWGIFELLMGGQRYSRYPNWAAMDMSAFTQQNTGRSPARG